jgi:Peptidase S24-like
MARRKTLPESVRAKLALAERLAGLRSELFGERGGPEMARRLGIPVRTWYNYEAGVTVPAEVILKIIELTAIEPSWLLHGKGPKFRQGAAERHEAGSTPAMTVGALLRTALQLLEGQNPGDPSAGAGTAHEGSTGLPRGEGEHRHDAVFDPDEDFDPDLENGYEHHGDHQLGDNPAARSEWLAAQRENRCIHINGDAMAPVVSDGASVAYSAQEENPAQLHNKLVVVWHEGRPMVRWFQNCGRYALLKAQNPETVPQQILIDLEDHEHPPRFRRVLSFYTPH